MVPLRLHNMFSTVESRVSEWVEVVFVVHMQKLIKNVSVIDFRVDSWSKQPRNKIIAHVRVCVPENCVRVEALKRISTPLALQSWLVSKLITALRMVSESGLP